jgi:hypothetical protein
MLVKIKAAEARKKMIKSMSKTAVVDAGRSLARHGNVYLPPNFVDTLTLYRNQDYRW